MPASNDDVGFRLDNCLFTMPVVVRGMTSRGIYGLVDHCAFVPTVHGSIHAIDIIGSDMNGDGGITPWKRPLTLGTNKAVYIEDCKFDYTQNDAGDDCIDCYAGARWVIRYCTFINISTGSHGLDSGGTQSSHSWEVYNNTFTNNGPVSLRHSTVRGGTGVYFNNTWGGSKVWTNITMVYYRANNTAPSWAPCDGTKYRVDAVDSTQSGYWKLSTTGTFAFDNATNSAVGTYGGSNTTYFDGSGPSGYPGREQPGFTTGQALAPVYIWNNSGGSTPNQADTWDGANLDSGILTTFMQKNREWYEGTAMPGYTPLVHPHPLINGGSTGTIAPSNAKIAVVPQ